LRGKSRHEAVGGIAAASETIRQLVMQAGMRIRASSLVLHGDDVDGSDLDILIDPAPKTSLLDLAGLQIEIEARMGVKVEPAHTKVPPGEIQAKGSG